MECGVSVATNGSGELRIRDLHVSHGEQERRPSSRRGRDRDPLLLAARE